ncbi:MAG: ThuA domain-containing protein [Prolixibacteraceae bacterium]|nr:ThuA domain-containing protein [Prolixibacteraceae bacterium]
MKCLVIILTLCLSLPTYGNENAPAKKKPRILLITGGHDYDKNRFTKLMEQLPVVYDHVEHPNAYAMLKPENIAKYDAVMLYDMPKEIPEEAQRNFIAMLKAGKGLVALHHAFCSYDFWPEYVKIIGGRYHHYPWKKDGVEQPVSKYKHDVEFNVRVEDSKHPVTKGVADFRIVDEAYGGTEILPTVHSLLSTDEPSNGPLVCWANRYEKSNIVTLTLGHDHLAWENPSFIRILSQALLWVAK